MAEPKKAKVKKKKKLCKYAFVQSCVRNGDAVKYQVFGLMRVAGGMVKCREEGVLVEALGGCQRRGDAGLVATTRKRKRDRRAKMVLLLG